MPDAPAAPPADLRERIAAIQHRSSLGQSVLWAMVAIIGVVALLKYGLPSGDAVSGDELIFIVVAVVLFYLIFIRRQKNDVNADALVDVLADAWQAGRLKTAKCHQLDFDLTKVSIEMMGEGYWLISCDNEYGGVKTLGVHGDDARSLRGVEVYEGDAREVRERLEKSKAVMSGLERGYELKKAEVWAEKLGL